MMYIIHKRTPAENAENIVNILSWRMAYNLGYREPRYPVPVVWKHPGFRVDFEFYFMRGSINAMFKEGLVM